MQTDLAMMNAGCRSLELKSWKKLMDEKMLVYSPAIPGKGVDVN